MTLKFLIIKILDHVWINGILQLTSLTKRMEEASPPVPVITQQQDQSLLATSPTWKFGQLRLYASNVIPIVIYHKFLSFSTFHSTPPLPGSLFLVTGNKHVEWSEVILKEETFGRLSSLSSTSSSHELRQTRNHEQRTFIAPEMNPPLVPLSQSRSSPFPYSILIGYAMHGHRPYRSHRRLRNQFPCSCQPMIGNDTIPHIATQKATAPFALGVTL